MSIYLPGYVLRYVKKASATSAILMSTSNQRLVDRTITTSCGSDFAVYEEMCAGPIGSRTEVPYLRLEPQVLRVGFALQVLRYRNGGILPPFLHIACHI